MPKERKTIDGFIAKNSEFSKAYHKYKSENPIITKVEFAILLIEKQLQNETSK